MRSLQAGRSTLRIEAVSWSSGARLDRNSSIRGQYHRQSHHQDRDLGELDPRRNGRRRQRQDQRAEGEDQPVDQKHPPEQRAGGSARSPAESADDRGATVHTVA